MGRRKLKRFPRACDDGNRDERESSRLLHFEPKFLVFTTLTHAKGGGMLPLQSAPPPMRAAPGLTQCSRIRPLRSLSYWDVGGTEIAPPWILSFRSFTTNSGGSPNTISATNGLDTPCKARPWYTKLMF